MRGDGGCMASAARKNCKGPERERASVRRPLRGRALRPRGARTVRHARTRAAWAAKGQTVPKCRRGSLLGRPSAHRQHTWAHAGGWRRRAAAADMDALLRDPELQNSAKSLQHCAAKIGIAVPNETATKMLERWLYSERAHRLLKANGRNSLDKKLRTHAPAGATCTEPVPQPQGLSAAGCGGEPVQAAHCGGAASCGGAGCGGGEAQAGV